MIENECQSYSPIALSNNSTLSHNTETLEYIVIKEKYVPTIKSSFSKIYVLPLVGCCCYFLLDFGT